MINKECYRYKLFPSLGRSVLSHHITFGHKGLYYGTWFETIREHKILYNKQKQNKTKLWHRCKRCFLQMTWSCYPRWTMSHNLHCNVTRQGWRLAAQCHRLTDWHLYVQFSEMSTRCHSLYSFVLGWYWASGIFMSSVYSAAKGFNTPVCGMSLLFQTGII